MDIVNFRLYKTASVFITDMTARSILHKLVKSRLKTRNGKFRNIGLHKHIRLFSVFQEHKAEIRTAVLYGILKFLFRIKNRRFSAKFSGKRIYKRLRLCIENNAVNRLERKSGIINIYYFNKRIANTAVRIIRVGCLILIPDCLSRRKRMVTVAHGKKEH